MTATEAPDREPATTYVYLYGIADPDFDVPADDSIDAGLQATRIGRVSVVHATVERSLFDDLDAEDVSETSRLAVLAERHDRTLRVLSGAGTILPVRLGTLFPSAEAMRALIADHEAGLVRQLDRVRGHHEWVIRVRSAREETPVPADATGTAYLQRRRAERDARDARRDTVTGAMASVDETLHRLAAAVAGPGIGTGSSPSLSRAYLVADDTYPDFAAAVATATAELAKADCTLAINGPLPAYSFVGGRWEVPGS